MRPKWHPLEAKEAMGRTQMEHGRTETVWLQEATVVVADEDTGRAG
jgi:hypothetical protein